MFCHYELLSDGRLRCPTCSDETSRIWSHVPREKWPSRQCGVTASVPQLVFGVGDYLAKLLATMPFAKPDSGCGCGPMQADMNIWGPSGCRDRRAEIVAHLVKKSKAESTELPFGLDLADLLGELVDEAIRLAEVAPA